MAAVTTSHLSREIQMIQPHPFHFSEWLPVVAVNGAGNISFKDVQIAGSLLFHLPYWSYWSY